jgi:hypothetical protein
VSHIILYFSGRAAAAGLSHSAGIGLVLKLQLRIENILETIRNSAGV